jgi:hypothetical protein
MRDPTSSYANAGIALSVSGALKSNHHDKVETPSVGILRHHFYIFMERLKETTKEKNKFSLRF